jgi:hypothetical protein
MTSLSGLVAKSLTILSDRDNHTGANIARYLIIDLRWVFLIFL